MTGMNRMTEITGMTKMMGICGVENMTGMTKKTMTRVTGMT